MLIILVKGLVLVSLSFAITVLVIMNRERIKNKWHQFLVWRQERYVGELRDNIAVTKRGLTHLQKVHAEQNRELFRMQGKLL